MASTSDKPVHAPSEKHTLDEVLKSLQDLVRNDLNSVPTAPAKSRIKAAKIAAGDTYHAGEVIDELAASLAVLADQDKDPTAPTPGDTHAHTPSSAASTQPKLSPDSETTLEIAAESIDPVAPAEASPSISEPIPEPHAPTPEILAEAIENIAAPPEPAAPDPLAALDEETIDFGDDSTADPGFDGKSSRAADSALNDDQIVPTAASDAEPISPSHDSESAMTDRPSDVPEPSADEPRAEILSSDELESPNLELESIAVDLGDLGETIAPVAATDPISSDDAIIPVSNFEAPSNELDFLPAIELDAAAADTPPAVDRSPQSAEAEQAARTAAPESAPSAAARADKLTTAKSSPDTGAVKTVAPNRSDRAPDPSPSTHKPKPAKTASADGIKRAITGGVQQVLPLAPASPPDAPTAASAPRTPTIPLNEPSVEADGQSSDSEWDDIPILENAVDLKSAGEGSVVLTTEQARRAVIKVVARLNVELRRAGKRSLNTAVITRLAQLLQEELAPARANVDNKPVKKR